MERNADRRRGWYVHFAVLGVMFALLLFLTVDAFTAPRPDDVGATIDWSEDRLGAFFAWPLALVYAIWTSGLTNWLNRGAKSVVLVHVVTWLAAVAFVVVANVTR